MHEYITVSIKDIDSTTKIYNTMSEYGVCVISDIYTPLECSQLTSRIVSSVQIINPLLDLENIKDTWTTENLPPQTRPGLFQTLLSNLDEVWEIRTNEQVYNTISGVYSLIGKKPIKKLVVSEDGINLKPGSIGPLHSAKDWAHLDQTYGNNDDCIQGQVVLSNSTAGFVCSPKSHLIFKKLLKVLGLDDCKDKSNWLKFTDEQVEVVKRMVTEVGGEWQVPIVVSKGSMILWYSSTIHSAKYQNSFEYPTTQDKWNGWRCVVYVCYRPKDEVDKKQRERLRKCFEENRGTYHWGTRMVSKKPGGRYLYTKPRCDVIESCLLDTTMVYDIVGTPQLSQLGKDILYN